MQFVCSYLFLDDPFCGEYTSIRRILFCRMYCFAECIAWIDECVRVCVAVKCEGGKGGL